MLKENNISKTSKSSLSFLVSVDIASQKWPKKLPTAKKVSGEAAKAAFSVVPPALRKKYKNVIVDIILTNDKKLQELNKLYRHKDYPTNVLSFPMNDLALPNHPAILGDIYISFETVSREAAECGKKLTEHLAHMAVHGVLHLLGYDHGVKRDADIMEALEVKALARMNIPDPYSGN